MSDGLDFLREMVTSAGIDPAALPLEERRALFESYASPAPDGVDVEVVDAGGVRAELLQPATGAKGRRILYLHGGGYETGSPGTVRHFAGTLAMAAAAECLTIDYRLAPEHPCPAAIDDARTAYEWLCAQGPGAIVLAGDSAGGGLAVALLLALRYTDLPTPSGAVLVAPWVDLALTGESFTTQRDADFILTPSAVEQAAISYAGERSFTDPLVSPLYGDLRGLPPLMIQVGDADLVRDDSLRLAERARAAGVDVVCELWERMPHVFVAFAGTGLLPEADKALQQIAAWVGTKTRQEQPCAD
jgi:acetyl esterase/lipase